MKLYLVKSGIVKCRYFFTDEAKALALYNELKKDESVVLKYLKTSDEWELSQLVKHFDQTKDSL